jgi:hypothetical protein
VKLEYNNPFTEKGNWYKGNLHTHTTHSDGKKTIKEHLEAYKNNGYKFLAITDHNKYTNTSNLSKDDFLLIQGQEVSVGTNSSGDFYHILALGLGDQMSIFTPDPDENPQKVIDFIKKENGVSIIAHPYWSGLDFNDLLKLKGYNGIEVYNHLTELLNDRGDSMIYWDALLSKKRRLCGFATDDTHNLNWEGMPSDYNGGWINVKSQELTQESIIDSIKKGLFYSSSGPEIKDIIIEDDTISVKTSPVQKIAFATRASKGIRGRVRCNKTLDKPITSMSYSALPRDMYVRVQVTDFNGHRAWSNPIYISSTEED